MKPKLKTWQKIGILAISFAIPAAVEGGERSRGVVAAEKRGTTIIKTTALNTKSSLRKSGGDDAKQNKQTKPIVRAQDLAVMSKAKKPKGKKPIKFEGIDGEFEDKGHDSWSVLDSYTEAVKKRRQR